MSTFPKYAVAIQIEVTDEQELCQAAKARAIEDGYDNVDELLRDRDGEIDVEGCLIMLFDLGQSPPGTEIEHSRVEHMRRLASASSFPHSRIVPAGSNSSTIIREA